MQKGVSVNVQTAKTQIGLLRHIIHIYPKYRDTYTPFDSLLVCLKCNGMANRVNPDQTAPLLPGPSCSNLTMSLVKDSLKFTSSDTQIY